MTLYRLPSSRLELWGGIECTVNRVGEQYFDQIAWSGHRDRIEDLERIAELGIRTLRYPVLWEWAAPERPDNLNWSWADERLPLLRQLGIRPIVGLVHHGSGPRYTSLLDPGFADGLADYAGRLAARFPWLEWFTPVNEPLTTARFSGLYGHWYPHGRQGRLFAQAFLNQCRAVVLAMRAIRRVQPRACLVQTEDLGKTHSTPALRYQADFENERRWLTFDLLAGRVDRNHPLADYFRYVGIAEPEWCWFLDHPCPPDVLGINHYLTSERFLDERLERYPHHCQGGNDHRRYADVEAVRVCVEPLGPEGLLRETWQRYQRPLAITEVHLGCTREEQMRWLMEVWRAAQHVRGDGGAVQAVTIWALLGCYDWDSLVTQARGHYEPGAYDLRAAFPRPTALASLARSLAAGQEPDHPALDGTGWWRQPHRLIYASQEGPTDNVTLAAAKKLAPAAAQRPLLIVGAGGTLGNALGKICAGRGLAYRCFGRADLDLTAPPALEAALRELRPWAVVNAAGYGRIDEAEREPELCYRANTLAPALLAEACARHGVALLTFSSDLVFDGLMRTPYRESDLTSPLCVYGRSKAEAERRVLAHYPQALVIRTSALFGPWDEANFVARTLRAVQRKERFTAADDLQVSPTYLPDLVHASLDLLIDGEKGIWHLANRGAMSWVELAREVTRRVGGDANSIVGRPARDIGWTAPRPAYSALGSERGLLLPPLEQALERYFAQG